MMSVASNTSELSCGCMIIHIDRCRFVIDSDVAQKAREQELKTENEALKKENKALKKENRKLQSM